MIINIFAPINYLGYGVHSYNYMKTLADKFLIYYTPIGQIQCKDQEFLNKLNRNFDKNSPSIMIFHENYMNQFAGSIRIGFPVFECDHIDDLSKRLLEQLDYIFVTSEWAKSILFENSIFTRCYVIGEGVDTDIYKPIKEKYIDTNKFTFITVGKHELRKNTDLILKTYIDNFRNTDTALIMHTYNHFTKIFSGIDPFKYGYIIENENDKYIKFSYGDSDIYFSKPIENDLSLLYNSANIGIYPSRGEGYCLPLIESLACGLPCVATNCSGQSEYLNILELKTLQNDLLIGQEYLEKEIADDGIWFRKNKGNWYKFKNNNILTDKMKLAYNNFNRYDKDEISSVIRNTFSWKKTLIKTIDAFKDMGIYE